MKTFQKSRLPLSVGCTEDEGSKILRNVGILPHHYMYWRWRQQDPPKRRYLTTNYSIAF